MAWRHGDDSAPGRSFSFLNSAGLPVVFCLLLRKSGFASEMHMRREGRIPAGPAFTVPKKNSKRSGAELSLKLAQGLALKINGLMSLQQHLRWPGKDPARLSCRRRSFGVRNLKIRKSSDIYMK
ncbi:hypothetical protein QEZ48_01325 [Aquamicrobium lusatiense]|uniref:hypothetical protein n=1 Tax=Aquamicrobium lusatiense TaxID=89772 RepID=UPI002458C54E|nr:hypothetical protein [Aquamicrobium lusatiense]MDH4989469.1 hypothetical protein [Aquamicrobium lusatiense]